ncbi:MAG: DoxX family membrane protein [Proteobacteria bacterium]|nr:DoxX family membrane protein [Pseudomonadota bacterium]
MNRLLAWSGHAWLALPMRWYLGYVFIYACLHKIAHPESFAVDVATYSILPLFLVNLMAIALPWVELAAGVMLIIGFRSRAAGLVISGMMVMFMIALLIALSQGLDMSCGCFASQGAQGEDPISYKTVLRDAGWLTLALYIFLFDRNSLGLDRMLAKRRKIHA